MSDYNLTDIEKEILKWVSLGKTNIEIGIILGIKGRRVQVYISSILNKLDAHDRTLASTKAIALKIIDLDLSKL